MVECPTPQFRTSVVLSLNIGPKSGHVNKAETNILIKYIHLNIYLIV
jgi:hypothetical protein